MMKLSNFIDRQNIKNELNQKHQNHDDSVESDTQTAFLV